MPTPVAPPVPHQHPGRPHEVEPEHGVVVLLCTGVGQVLGAGREGGGRGGKEGEVEHRLCIWRDRRETGRGEEGAGSAVNARQRDTQSPPSETADMTCDFARRPALDHIYLLRQL